MTRSINAAGKKVKSTRGIRSPKVNARHELRKNESKFRVSVENLSTHSVNVDGISIGKLV